MQNLGSDPRRSWSGLSRQEKQRRLAGLRSLQQRQVEIEARRLDAIR